MTSRDFNSHLLIAMVARVTRMLSLEQVGESFRDGCISSNPLAHNLAFMLSFPSMILGLITHVVDIVGWPMLSTSSYTSCNFQFSSSWVLASRVSSCCRDTNASSRIISSALSSASILVGHVASWKEFSGVSLWNLSY